MEAINSQNTHKHHAIFLPLGLQGHINPAINLSLKLASSKNFTISFLTFEHHHQQLTQVRPSDNLNDIFSRARQGPNGLDIRDQVISDGLPLDYDRAARPEEYLGWYLYGDMLDHIIKGVEKIVLNSKPKVDVLIIDTFFPWGSKIAKKFGLRFVSFWTEPALVFNIYYHVHLLKQHGHLDAPDTRTDPIDYIPGISSIEPKDLMSYLQDKDISTNMHQLIFQAYEDVRLADYVLCNTVQEIESNAISTLQNVMAFYSIGPIFPSKSLQNVVSISIWAKSNCSEWLGSKPNGSVLYVSFGSLANFTKKDIMEIAYGLMKSNIDFVWVLRPGIVLHEDDHLLPDGFEEEILGRGIVVPWTDQIAVLSHPAVGGFLTHCGWNSILESIWYQVPMLCFPVFCDQFTNRKLVVDDWNVGVDLVSDKTLTKLEIATQIKSFMSQKTRDELIDNIFVVREILEGTLENNGSSRKNLDKFVENLSK